MGFARLDNLIDGLKAFERGLFDVIAEAVRDNEHIVVEYVSEDQLFEQGITREGIKIASYAPYKANTKAIKSVKGQPTNRVTLRDEGDFHNSFYIDFRPDGFEIKAGDWKTEGLVYKYGEEILGLTDENFKDLAEAYVLPKIIQYFKTLRI